MIKLLPVPMRKSGTTCPFCPSVEPGVEKKSEDAGGPRRTLGTRLSGVRFEGKIVEDKARPAQSERPRGTPLAARARHVSRRYRPHPREMRFPMFASSPSTRRGSTARFA